MILELNYSHAPYVRWSLLFSIDTFTSTKGNSGFASFLFVLLLFPFFGGEMTIFNHRRITVWNELGKRGFPTLLPLFETHYRMI